MIRIKETICPIFKGKGSLCDISLLSVVAKLYSSVLTSKVCLITHVKLNNMQERFLPGRSCVDKSFTLRMIIDKHLSEQAKLSCTFIDRKKAHNSGFLQIIESIFF